MRAVDTNVLVRLIARDDPAQVAAAEEFVSGGAWVSHLVLIETAWVLTSAYGVERNDLVFAIEALLDHEQIAVDQPDVVEAALSVYRKRPSLSFSDTLILEVARKAGHLPLGTFDRGLSRVDGAAAL